MKRFFKLSFLLLITVYSQSSISQTIIENYAPLKKDNLRIGTGPNDFMPYIQSGYTLMLPENKTINGVLIFLEDSGYDQKNKSAKQMYGVASEKGFAVLSVSTEIPFDFYFSKTSIGSAHQLIKEAFTKHKLPNKNIFFLGASLTGHRGLRYIKYMKESNTEFQLHVEGVVICNFTLDWTRKWLQHERDIRINRINLWEPKFMNYMLETHLNGTPETNPHSYHDFSAYSYFDKENRNIKVYKDYAVRAYVEPALNYKLKKQFRTLYENNVTDMVGFLAELALAGNENTELIVIQPENAQSKKRNTQASWDEIDKKDLMNWVQKQVK